MSRYLIKFSKEGTIRYISHLDLLRLFKRSFKRIGVKLQHSQGFNPHPKMSFAQPLSLGYSSSCECLEFDTTEPYPTEEILQKINSVMPEGIEIFYCGELPEQGKTLAALTEAAAYEITIPAEKDHVEIDELISRYMAREHITIRKHQKKSGKDVEIDIRPMMLELSGKNDDKYIMLITKLAAGSTANLSPEAVLSSFCEFACIQYDRSEVFIKRTELFFTN